MQQKWTFMAVVMLAFNAYGASSDTARWPVGGNEICNTAINLYDPHDVRVAATLWVSSFGAPKDHITFAHRLLMHIEQTDSVQQAVGDALERNRSVLHAHLEMRIGAHAEVHVWGWVKDNKICTAVDQR